ncbi:hypothetical protein GQ44DRAFT_677196 [Phaeosphaeriaceae sp. PMI808]|nr:hypothetical protein GQ44DRAFT_677196 [Phaeosphaeriaceae sp. PMI808]
MPSIILKKQMNYLADVSTYLVKQTYHVINHQPHCGTPHHSFTPPAKHRPTRFRPPN